MRNKNIHKKSRIIMLNKKTRRTIARTRTETMTKNKENKKNKKRR